MKVLAIETATAVCAAAIIQEGKVLAEDGLLERHIHSEKLIPIIDHVVAKAGRYDAISVSVGPGSFTGLRIGLSVAKGLAFANGKPLVAVPTLEALAWRAVYEGLSRGDDQVIAMIDARRNDVYAAAYQIDGKELSVLWDAQALSLEELTQKISLKRRTIFMGDGVSKLQIHFSKTERSDSEGWYFPPLEQRLCSAAAVGLLGHRKAQRGEFADLSSLEPMYVKDFLTLVKTQHLS